MDWLFIVYTVLLAFYIWKASKKGTLYVFNPLLSLYFVFFSIQYLSIGDI